MVAGGRLGSEDAGRELGGVEIDFEDAALGPGQLDQPGEAGLQPLAGPAPPVPEKDVLRHLLADRGCAAEAAMLALCDRGTDRIEVEAPYVAEARLLRRQ